MARILVINPNSTASMTEAIARSAETAAGAGTTIVARTSRSGPPAIQGRADGRAALPGLFREITDSRSDNFDAIIIACFDDTGLHAARRLTRVPVIGIGEAAFHLAMFVADRFSVVTTLSVSQPIIEENLVRYGLASRCARVRASDVPVLDLEREGSGARAKISAEIAKAMADDHADAIVLGCAGMTALAASLADEHGLPVIDGVAAAVRIGEALAALHLGSSQVGPFAMDPAA